MILVRRQVMAACLLATGLGGSPRADMVLTRLCNKGTVNIAVAWLEETRAFMAIRR